MEVESWTFDVGCSFCGKDERSTSNAQHRTSNEKDFILDVRSVEKMNVEHSTLNIERRMEKIRYFRTSNE